MAPAIALILLSACGFGYPNVIHCDSIVYGKGVDSVDMIDCSKMNLNALLALGSIVRKTHIDPELYLKRMRHVHVEVRSVYGWQHNGAEWYGQTTVDQIVVGSNAHALAHETIHAFNAIGFSENLGSILALPVELAKDDSHDGWKENGYLDADNDFMTIFVNPQVSP